MTMLVERGLADPATHSSPVRTITRLRWVVLILDLVAVGGAIGLGAIVDGPPAFGLASETVVASSRWVVPALTTGWIAALWYFGGYRHGTFAADAEEVGVLLRASLTFAGALGLVCYLTKYELSRSFFLLVSVLGTGALLLSRLALRRAVHAARRRGHFVRRALVAGDHAHVDELYAVLTRESQLGFHAVGAMIPDGHTGSRTPAGLPVLAPVNDAARAAQEHQADVIFFANGSFASSQQMRLVTWQLEQLDVEVMVAPGVSNVSRQRSHFRPMGGLPMIHVGQPRAIQASRWAKRSFDLLMGSLLIVALLPVLTFAALQVRLHDGGPVLFRQTRVGKDGAIFSCFKFRTMVPNAEELIEQMQSELGVSPLLFKHKDDPRITRPGKWLRRFSLDELPQLFNVILGQMSLIGPRPQVPREVAEYDDLIRRRLRVRPGMTGLWQVSGRNDLSVADAVRLDLYYVDNWSMTQDLGILFRTFGAVLSSRGAY